MTLFIRFFATVTILTIATTASAQRLTVENNSKIALAFNFLPESDKSSAKNEAEATLLAENHLASGGEWVAEGKELEAIVVDLFLSSSSEFQARLLYSNVDKGIRLYATESPLYILELALLRGYNPKKSDGAKMQLQIASEAWVRSLRKVGIHAETDFYYLDSQDYIPASIIDKNLELNFASIDISSKMTPGLQGTEFLVKYQEALASFKALIHLDVTNLDFEAPELELQRQQELLVKKQLRKKANKEILQIVQSFEAKPILLVTFISAYVEKGLYFKPSNDDLENKLIYALVAARSPLEIKTALLGFEYK